MNADYDLGTLEGGANGATEDQHTERAKPEVFTSEPASANLKLMDFEAQLLMKAGNAKLAPVKPPTPQKSHREYAHLESEQSQPELNPLRPKAQPKFKIGIPKVLTQK